MNSELESKVDRLSEKVSTQEQRIDENERDRIRYEIFDFANSCRNKRKHSQEEFNHIFELNDKYHQILRRRSESNGKIASDMRYIESLYLHCQEQNDFLS